MQGEKRQTLLFKSLAIKKWNKTVAVSKDQRLLQGFVYLFICLFIKEETCTCSQN